MRRLALLLLLAACDSTARKAAEEAEDHARAASREAARAQKLAQAAQTEASAAKDEAKAAKDEAKAAKEEAKAAKEEAKAAKALAEKKSTKCTATPHTPKATGPKLKFSVKGVEINGKLLPDRPKIADVRALLGVAERVDKAANDIHVYEKLGIIVYQTPGKDRVVQLTVLFQPMPWAFMPKETFTGTLEYDGRTIDVASVVTEAKFDKEQKLYADTDGGCLETIGVGFAE
ncbi:MAG: hypothetical protein IPJ34_14570 [Myxococcales bacterium]|nr:hypothetical protein [Myxococcales bacterium]